MNALALLALLASLARGHALLPGDELGPAKRAEIAASAARWMEAKALAGRMIDAFAAAPDLDASERERLARRLRAMASSIEDVEAKVAELARAEIRAAQTASTLRDGREAAVDELFAARMLALYGNLVPRLLDDAVTEGGEPVGRRWAGPEWRVAIALHESAAYNRWELAQAGFTPDRYDALGRRARESLLARR